MSTKINPTHEAADAFWKHFKENDGKHGYYESTWGAINAALAIAGVYHTDDIALAKRMFPEEPNPTKGKTDG